MDAFGGLCWLIVEGTTIPQPEGSKTKPKAPDTFVTPYENPTRGKDNTKTQKKRQT